MPQQGDGQRSQPRPAHCASPRARASQHDGERGRVLLTRFYPDPKGNPMIEVLPVPQGRKKPKQMGLYKVWHDPPPALRVPEIPEIPVVAQPAVSSTGPVVATGIEDPDDANEFDDDDEDDDDE